MRLDCVMQADPVDVAAFDVHVAHAQSQVHRTASRKVAGIAARFFVIPVVIPIAGRAPGNP